MLTVEEVDNILLNDYGYIHTHTHDSGVTVLEHDAIQTITRCLASVRTHRRVDVQNEILRTLARDLKMSIVQTAEVEGERFVRKGGKSLTYGVVSSLETTTTDVSSLRRQRMEVSTPDGFDPQRLITLERTIKVIFVPCKHLLGHCSKDELPTLGVGPSNWNVMDWLNLQFVK